MPTLDESIGFHTLAKMVRDYDVPLDVARDQLSPKRIERIVQYAEGFEESMRLAREELQRVGQQKVLLEDAIREAIDSGKADCSAYQFTRDGENRRWVEILANALNGEKTPFTRLNETKTPEPAKATGEDPQTLTTATIEDIRTCLLEDLTRTADPVERGRLTNTAIHLGRAIAAANGLTTAEVSVPQPAEEPRAGEVDYEFLLQRLAKLYRKRDKVLAQYVDLPPGTRLAKKLLVKVDRRDQRLRAFLDALDLPR